MASFSAYRSSRCRHATGRSSPSSAAPALRRGGDRLVGVLAELGALDHRRPLVEQPDQGAQQPGLALAALAEQHDVVAGDQGALELRDDGAARSRAGRATGRGPRASAASRLSRISCAQVSVRRGRRRAARRRWWVRGDRSLPHATPRMAARGYAAEAALPCAPWRSRGRAPRQCSGMPRCSPSCARSTEEFVRLVTALLDDAGINYVSVTGRTKSVASFAAKAARTVRRGAGVPRPAHRDHRPDRASAW